MSESAQVILKANVSFEDHLKTLKGAKKTVTLVLKNGKAYSGYVTDVDSGSVVLSELVGKEFYDALISVPDITALELRAKNG